MWESLIFREYFALYVLFLTNFWRQREYLCKTWKIETALLKLPRPVVNDEKRYPSCYLWCNFFQTLCKLVNDMVQIKLFMIVCLPNCYFFRVKLTFLVLHSALSYTWKAVLRQAAIEITSQDHSTGRTLGDFIVLKLLWYLVAAFGELIILSPRLQCASSAILLRRQPCDGTCTITLACTGKHSMHHEPTKSWRHI